MIRIMAPYLYVLSFVTLTAAQANAADEYRVDDGTAETNVGVGEPPFGLACLNHFIAQPGALTIGSLSITWGLVPDNTPATLLVYRDPNQDGNPIDADWIYGGGITTSSTSGNDFVTYNFTPQTFAPGESFFVGFWLQQPSGGWGPAAFDTDIPQGESWLVISFQNFFINELGLNALPPTRVENVNGLGPGNWMIRANAVPAPGGLAMLVAALIVSPPRRRNAIS